MNDFYVYLSSDDSLNFYPENKPNKFSVHFTEQLNLPGDWMCALTEISMPTSLQGDIYIACNITECMYTVRGKYPILRRLFNKSRYTEFINRNYVKVVRSSLQSLSIYITDDKGVPISFKDGRLKCTLHFTRSQ